MKFTTLIKMCIVLMLVLALGLVTGGAAFAKKGGNGQGGNGGDGGGNDTPDPDYAIQADMVDEGCLAYNPDLKGPGIAFGGFYDYVGVAPFTCAAITTSLGEQFYLRTLGVIADENGQITSFYLRGRNADNVLFDSAEQLVGPFQAPLNGDPITLELNTTVVMQTCNKVKGTTTCTNVGNVFVGTLVYANIGF